MARGFSDHACRDRDMPGVRVSAPVVPGSFFDDPAGAGPSSATCHREKRSSPFGGMRKVPGLCLTQVNCPPTPRAPNGNGQAPDLSSGVRSAPPSNWRTFVNIHPRAARFGLGSWAWREGSRHHRLFAFALLLLGALHGGTVHALPLFARQTGQPCAACHAGGQFPELTPFGRVFKLTGYTIGTRTVPVSVMAVASDSRVANTSKSDDPAADFQKNGDPLFASASLFLGGKVTDRIGAFVQITYDNYASQSDNGDFHGHTGADNIDIRYANQFSAAGKPVIWGISANNNPSIADPWNTAAAWMQYVPVPSPTSSSFIDGNAPYPGFASGGNLSGISAYALWNQLLYVEVGNYRSATGLASFMSAGVADAEKTRLRGNNPYWRVALTRDWGAHNLMVGTSGMTADVYDDPLDTSDPATLNRFTDIGIDAQYQYLRDPHAVTLQLAWLRDRHRYPAFLAGQPVVDINGNALPDTNASDTTRVLRAKASYIFENRYGGSVAWFKQTGTTNSLLYDPTRVYGNVSANPGISGETLEAFWTPVQNLRLGVQYTAYGRYNGATHNYDGQGRNPGDNNSLFLYAWAAY
jgi:hypothetical protein